MPKSEQSFNRQEYLERIHSFAGDTTCQRSALRDVVGYLGRVLTNKP